MKLSFIIPVYNEEKRLSKGLHTALTYLNKQPYSWQLIVVDDGSTDATPRILKTWQPKLVKGHNLYLLRSQQNFGKGHAIKTGIKIARGNYIIFSDIDFSVPIRFTQIFLNELKHYDVVIGSRRLARSKIPQHQNVLRESLGYGFTKISNLILGLNYSDHTCGFKGFKKQKAKKLSHLQKINGWAFDSEILFLANKLNYSVKETPVEWRNNPLTKVALFKDLILSFASLLQIHLNDISGKYK